eukprot:jgi/Phyca11/107068/e_gw1.13.99.1
MSSKQLTLDAFFRSTECTPASLIEHEGTTYVYIADNIGKLQPSLSIQRKCGCKASCGKNCRNRRRRIDCNAETCSLDRCGNRRWKGSKLVPLELRRTLSKGIGAFAVKLIPEGTVVREYVGEIITEHEKRQRDSFGPAMYTMEYVPGWYIDARHYGNASRFFNHSCDPNCAAEEWIVSDSYRIGIVALRDTLPGEEITFNYGSEYFFDNCKCSKCVREPRASELS